MAYRQGVSGIAACLPPSPLPPENDRPGPAGPALARRPRTTASPALPVASWSCLPRRTLPPPPAGPTPLPPSGAREKCYCRANPCPRRMCSKPARTGAVKKRGNRCAARPGRRIADGQLSKPRRPIYPRARFRPPVASGGPGPGPAYSNLQSSPCAVAGRPAWFRNPAGTCAMRRRGGTCGSRPLQTPAGLRSRIRLPPGREPGADAVLRRAAAAGRLDPARLGRQLEPAGAAGSVVLQAPAQDILPARAGEAEADLRD